MHGGCSDVCVCVCCMAVCLTYVPTVCLLTGRTSAPQDLNVSLQLSHHSASEACIALSATTNIRADERHPVIINIVITDEPTSATRSSFEYSELTLPCLAERIRASS